MGDLLLLEDDFIFLLNQDDDQSLVNGTAISQDDVDPYAFRSLSDTQKTILAILPIPSAILSIFGSSVIIYMAYRSRRSRPWSPYNRLLVAMSVYDITSSIALGIAAFMNNKETSNKGLAMGNDSTCSAIGFLVQLSYSGTLYNAALSYYFLFTARFGMKNDQIARCIEPFMHIFNIGFPLITGIVGLVMGVYAEPVAGIGCWVYRYPKGCGSGPNTTGEPCLGTLLSYVFGAWIGFFTLGSLLINNLIIWAFVRQQIKEGLDKSARLSIEGTSVDADDGKSTTHVSLSGSSFRSQYSVNHQDLRASQTRRLRLVRSQAFLFVASYIASSMITYILRLFETQAFEYVDEMELPYNHYTLMVLQSILLPLQGLFNMMIYIRPRYLRLQNQYPKESRAWVLRRAVGGSKVEPIHSLGEVHVKVDGGRNANITVGNAPQSSLTNASNGQAKVDKGKKPKQSSVARKSIPSRASSAGKRSSNLVVISEMSLEEDSGSLSVSSNNVDQYGPSSRSTVTNGSASGRVMMMDGSILQSPQPS